MVTDGYPADLTFDNNDTADQNFTVHLKHQLTPVNPSQPTMPAKPVQAGQAADRTNRVSPQGAEAEHNSATSTPKAANNQLAKREAKKNNLPQTGEQHTSVGIIGLLAIVLGFFGLTDHKKKKDE